MLLAFLASCACCTTAHGLRAHRERASSSSAATEVREGSAALRQHTTLVVHHEDEDKKPKDKARPKGNGKPKPTTVVKGRNVLILVGPPAAGKGTQAPKLAAALNITHLSTGDLLRDVVASGSELGKKLGALMSTGALVSDSVVINAVKQRISKKDCLRGFVLDGFPRTTGQAKSLDKMLAQKGDKVDRVLEIKLPEASIVGRITGRWVHKASGRSYHVLFKPPKSYKGGKATAANMLDDETNEPLMQRADDTAKAAKGRIKKFKKETIPVLEHYAHKVTTVNGDQDMDLVWADIVDKMHLNSPKIRRRGARRPAGLGPLAPRPSPWPRPRGSESPPPARQRKKGATCKGHPCTCSSAGHKISRRDCTGRWRREKCEYADGQCNKK